MKLESNWLVSSQTVADIQRFFGLERLDTEKTLHLNNSQSPESNGHTTSTTSGVHKRRAPSQSKDDATTTETSTKDELRYTVKNKFWYWIFAFGATLGDDIFYYTFYPFWFYNLSPWVIRRVMLMSGLIMYVGQSSKEILRWPRPSDPPAVRIEKRYFQEYGMPSTHAMVGTLVPFTILAVTWNHYEYSHAWGITLASAYTLLVCFSRLYRGMHYILDIIVGTGACFLLLAINLQYIDKLDYFLVTHPYAPIPLITTCFFLCLIHPCKEGWSSTCGDTTMTLSCIAGMQTASWTCNNLGWIIDAELPVTHPVTFPEWTSLALMLLRELIGLCCMAVVHVTVGSTVLFFMSLIAGHKIDRSKNEQRRIRVELPYKFITYFCITFIMVMGSPMVFKALGIPIYTFNL